MIAAAIASLVGALWCFSRRAKPHATWQDCERTLAWAAPQLAAGTERELSLPKDLAGVAYDGTATALRAGDGRTCVVIKNYIGLHDGFTGTLCCDAPVRSDELHRSHDNAFDFVRPSGARDLVEMVVEERLSDRWFRVSYGAP